MITKEAIKYLLKEHESIEEQILEHFNFEQDWDRLPLKDHTDLYWSILQETKKVIYNETSSFCKEDYYESDLLLCNPVNRVGGLTLIRASDIRCDRNKSLLVFDDDLEVMLNLALLLAY